MKINSEDKAAIYEILSESQRSILREHFSKQYRTMEEEPHISIVFDLLQYCNLRCLGCGTSALDISKKCGDYLSEDRVYYLLEKIKEFSIEEKKQVVIFFGGGEPLLRNDIVRIIKKASELFGSQNIGIDSNGSLDYSAHLINEIAPYLSYIGISVNGLHDYHNWWSNVSQIDAYDNTMDTIRAICHNEDIIKKLEVTSVATTRNIETLPILMEELQSLGVKNYSIHRAFPVGRMFHFDSEILPDWKQYLLLLCHVLEMGEKLSMNVHLHHSIESIHATLLCGYNTFSEKALVEKNYRSSISIDMFGNLYINPWATLDYWELLKLGNLFDANESIKDIFNKKSQIISDINESYSLKSRCNGCLEPCSGGSRIISAIAYLRHMNYSHISYETLIHALKQKDPACPYYAR